MCDDLLVWLNKKKKGKHEIVCNYVQCCVEVSEICCCCCRFFLTVQNHCMTRGRCFLTGSSGSRPIVE